MITISEKLLSGMLEGYEGRDQGPEQFLGFITLMAKLIDREMDLNGQANLLPESMEQELAGIFLDVVEIDIAPYASYIELKSRCPLKEDIYDKFEKIVAKFKENDALYNLTEEMGIMPSKDTMIKEIALDLATQFLIEQLRPHLHIT